MIPNVELIDTILSEDSLIESDFNPGDWYHIEVSENLDTVIAKTPKDIFAGLTYCYSLCYITKCFIEGKDLV